MVRVVLPVQTTNFEQMYATGAIACLCARSVYANTSARRKGKWRCNGEENERADANELADPRMPHDCTSLD